MDEKALKKSNSCESPKKMVTFERILSFFLLLFLPFALYPVFVHLLRSYIQENVYIDV